MSATFHHAFLRDIAPGILYRILWLRVSVFVVEQTAAYPELDGRDLEEDAEQFWAEENGDVTSTLRLLRDPDTARIGRVATAAGSRGQGHSAELMGRAIERVEESSAASPIVLDAQEHLAGWYGRFGFAVCGERFYEDGIAHVPMRREPSVQQPRNEGAAVS